MHVYACPINTQITFHSSTYDHRLRKNWYPVRSALIKTQIDRLVVGWVTTSESRLLYVLIFCHEAQLFYSRQRSPDSPGGVNYLPTTPKGLSGDRLQNGGSRAWSQG